jgi:hypothetical protein
LEEAVDLSSDRLLMNEYLSSISMVLRFKKVVGLGGGGGNI